MKLTNVIGTRLSDEELASLRRLADQEERRPADVLRRLVRQAIKATSDDRRPNEAGVSLHGP